MGVGYKIELFQFVDQLSRAKDLISNLLQVRFDHIVPSFMVVDQIQILLSLQVCPFILFLH